MTHFIGLAVIRTFRREAETTERFHHLQDVNSSAVYLFYCSLRWFATRCDVISTVLTFGICIFIVTNTETITPDMAGAMLALALQLSVLYQMSLRNGYDVKMSQFSTL